MCDVDIVKRAEAIEGLVNPSERVARKIDMWPELLGELKAARADNARMRADMQRSLDTRVIA